jgi:hypothetical protein
MTSPPAGRERNCAQCSTTYRAPRATSRYCTPACRKRANRGSPITDRKRLDLLRRWLLRRSYAGQIGPINRRDPRPPIYALSVPREAAWEEWNQWNPGAAMTVGTFASSLDQLGIYGLDYVPPHRQRH